jgi:hypothetical protein
VLIDFITENNIIHKAEGRVSLVCHHTGNVYMHPAYVTKGHKDFGLLSLQAEEFKGITNASKVERCDAVVRQSVVSHGLVFLQGTVMLVAIGHG